jgi:hypothetical protein
VQEAKRQKGKAMRLANFVPDPKMRLADLVPKPKTSLADAAKGAVADNVAVNIRDVYRNSSDD